jgi:hypothetical protein
VRGKAPPTSPTFARMSAETLNVTINALAIESEEKDLARWYHRNIVTVTVLSLR